MQYGRPVGGLIKGGTNEKRKSPHTGVEDYDEGPRAGAGELAGSEESSGLSGGGEPGGAQADRREAEVTDYFKKFVERRKDVKKNISGTDRNKENAPSHS